MQGKLDQFKTWMYWQRQYFWYGLYTFLTQWKKSVRSKIDDQIVAHSIDQKHGEAVPMNSGRGKWFYR